MVKAANPAAPCEWDEGRRADGRDASQNCERPELIERIAELEKERDIVALSVMFALQNPPRSLTSEDAGKVVAIVNDLKRRLSEAE